MSSINQLVRHLIYFSSANIRISLDTLVPLPASCSLPVLQCVLPIDCSRGSQHHSSVISMETSPSRGNDWAPSQSLPFCDRTAEAVLPAPSSQRHSPSYTHIFPFVLFLHLYGVGTETRLTSLSGVIASGWNAFWHRSISEDETHSWSVNMSPTSQPYWENRHWSGDLLVWSFSCFFLHRTSLLVCYSSWACFSAT